MLVCVNKDLFFLHIERLWLVANHVGCYIIHIADLTGLEERIERTSALYSAAVDDVPMSTRSIPFIAYIYKGRYKPS